MTLTYEELQNTIPEKTFQFLLQLLSYLDCNQTEDIRVFNDNWKKDTHKQFFFSLLLCARDPEMGVLFHKYNYSEKRIDCYYKKPSKKNSIDFKEAYIKNSSVLPEYENPILYDTLHPMHILRHTFREFARYNDISFLKKIIPDLAPNYFGNMIDTYLEEQDRSIEKKLEKQLFTSLPISVISYLETASRVQSLFFSEMKADLENGVMKKTVEDIVPISLFLATFYYQDTQGQNEVDTSQTIMETLLENHGVRSGKVCSILGFSSIISNTPKSLPTIQKYYQKYYQKGACEGKKPSEICVPLILNNVFDRSISESFAVERLLAKFQCPIDTFSSFDLQVAEAMEEAKREKEIDYTRRFYLDLRKDTKDFIEFTAKIYTLLEKKMELKKHNLNVLKGPDDADTLALLIASYYFHGDVSEFFSDFGITLPKVFDFIGISLTKEEILQEPLDSKTLVYRFTKFVHEGVNSPMRNNQITISDVNYNLCNRDFNKTMILEEIFASLSNHHVLESDFKDQLTTHLTKKEEERKRNLTQKFFKDIPMETVELFEDASRIHPFLVSNLHDYAEKDIRFLSLLLSFFLSSDENLRGFLEKENFTKESVCSHLKISRSYNSSPIDIDLLISQYGSYLFGGKNKDIERTHLTLECVLENIFSKEIYYSVVLEKFLSSFGHCFDDYTHCKKKYHAYLLKKEEDKKTETYKGMITKYSSSTQDYLKMVLATYQMIMKKIEEKEIDCPILTTKEDAAEFSLVSCIFRLEGNQKSDLQKFFEKNQITLPLIQKVCGISEKDFESLSDASIDYSHTVPSFLNYVKQDNNSYTYLRTVDDLIKRIFDPTMNTSLFLENLIANIGGNYDILKQEVITGKDYELSLSVEERIALLEHTPIDELHPDDMKSILHFGNSLTVHSSYIQEKLPDLILRDSHDQSVEDINEILTGIYAREEAKVVEKPRSFLARIFLEPKLEKVEDSEPIFHQEKLQELNQKIDEDIQLLSQELLQYHQIRRYVEVYREKNQSYYVIAKELEEKVKEKLTTLDPKQDDQYGTFLRYHSLAQTMTAKVNRFATTSHVMQQELFKVNQAISNHFITMEALQMAKDGLLPIIVFELALGKGQDTEKNALNLSHHVIDLLQSLLTRNVSDAKHHMELLKSSNLPKELFDSLNDGVRAYLDDIHQLPLFGTKNGEENPEGISLSLFPKIEKEEVPLDGDPSPIQKSIKKS